MTRGCDGPFSHRSSREREGLPGKQVAGPGFKRGPGGKSYRMAYVLAEQGTKKQDAGYCHSPVLTGCYVRGSG